MSWGTSPGGAGCTTADQSPPGGQCRHQQVCVVGYGATLGCTAGCTPSCGGSSTLQACVTGPASRGPYTLKLDGSDGSSATQSAFGDPSGTTCVNFTVQPTASPTTVYTLTVTDKDGCTRTATTSLAVTSITASITPPSTSPCNGVLSFTASATGFSSCTFTWTIDGLSVASFAAGGAADDARVARVTGASSQTLEFRALDNTCHTIQVEASCTSGSPTTCKGTASTTAKQCTSSTLGCQ